MTKLKTQIVRTENSKALNMIKPKNKSCDKTQNFKL